MTKELNLASIFNMEQVAAICCPQVETEQKGRFIDVTSPYYHSGIKQRTTKVPDDFDTSISIEPLTESQNKCERCNNEAIEDETVCESCAKDVETETLASFKGWDERNAENGYRGEGYAKEIKG